MIIGVTGLTENTWGDRGSAGAGKDVVADRLIAKHGFVRVALADPLKRYCLDAFDFSIDQLWGPSHLRNEPDKRWLRWAKGSLGTTYQGHDQPLKPSPEEDIYLTPRHALQQLGTEWGRACSSDVWVRYALRVAALIAQGECAYDAQHGVRSFRHVGVRFYPPVTNVVISDVRFKNEMAAIRQAGGKVIRVHRDIDGPAGEHVSETELLDTPGAEFDHVIVNDMDLAALNDSVDAMMATWASSPL